MSPVGWRNCYRCGQDFPVSGPERICAACRKPPAVPDPASPLTPRQRQIIGLVHQAKANKEIAAELHLSDGTIKEYLNQIYRKLGLPNRTALALWARDNLTPPG